MRRFDELILLIERKICAGVDVESKVVWPAFLNEFQVSLFDIIRKETFWIISFDKRVKIDRYRVEVGFIFRN